MSEAATVTRRGTSNGNDRGNAADRRARRAWMMLTYAANVPGLVRCYRCGHALYNPDDHPGSDGLIWIYGEDGGTPHAARPLTIDRIIPGCYGGTYRRNNIRPACGPCNSDTGGALAATPKRKKAKR